MATISTKEQLWRWVGLLLPIALCALLYVRTTTFDFSFLDDAFLKDEQPFFSNVGSIGAAFRSLYVLGTYYRPLVTASYVIDAQWTGAQPFGYHLTNVILHAIAIALVQFLLTRLRFSRPISAFVACVFAIHPALVESVAWIPGRNDSLFVVFALSAWLLLTFDVERPSLPIRLGYLAFLLAALFTKETAVVLPLLFAVYVWSIDSTTTWLTSKRLWPLWILGAASYAVVRARVVASQPAPALEIAQSGESPLAQIPVFLSSFGKLCLPIQLSPLATARDTAIWPGVVAAAGMAAALVLIRVQRPRILLLAASTYLLPLVPTLFVAERLTLENRLYLPAVGLCILVAEVATALLPGWRRLRVVIGACVLLGFVPMAWTYSSAYRNRETLAETSVARSPSSALAHLQRGDAYYTIEHDLDNAENEYRRAIEIDSRERIVHNNLAVVLMDRKRFSDAEIELRKEVEINSRYAPAHYNLGLVLRQTGRPDEAAAEWERALESDPNHMNSMGELLVYYSSRGEQTKAAYYMDQMTRGGMKFVAPPRADR